MMHIYLLPCFQSYYISTKSDGVNGKQLIDGQHFFKENMYARQRMLIVSSVLRKVKLVQFSSGSLNFLRSLALYSGHLVRHQKVFMI